MSTSSLITLHNIPSKFFDGANTASFYRHHDSDNGLIMSDMFYKMFDLNVCGGAVEAFICAAPSDVCLYDFKERSVTECAFKYHYHLDMKTFNLTLLKNDEKIFDGLVSEFINQHSNESKALVSKSEQTFTNSENFKLAVFTRDSLIKRMNDHVVSLSGLNTVNCKTNPNFKIHTRFLDRADGFLSMMNLSKEQVKLREAIQSITLTYQEMILS